MNDLPTKQEVKYTKYWSEKIAFFFKRHKYNRGDSFHFTDQDNDGEILPYPVVFPQLVLREDGRGDVAPLVLFSCLLHCLLVAFLGLNRHSVSTTNCLRLRN